MCLLRVNCATSCRCARTIAAAAAAAAGCSDRDGVHIQEEDACRTATTSGRVVHLHCFCDTYHCHHVAWNAAVHQVLAQLHFDGPRDASCVTVAVFHFLDFDLLPVHGPCSRANGLKVTAAAVGHLAPLWWLKPPLYKGLVHDSLAAWALKVHALHQGADGAHAHHCAAHRDQPSHGDGLEVLHRRQFRIVYKPDHHLVIHMA
mmetsp:Transcript_24918/g.80264  ORF Transcript_24918/g.80264 Transcript_24918/m.80264 type:complete len:203 (-) Transcript_24918:342-950(-)